jgi:23S rRNA (cytosine1962-C5)-methyltransferase
LELAHPRTGAVLVWEVAPDFSRPPGDGLRAAIIDQAETTAFRAIHGAADGAPGEYGERLGGWILVEGEGSGPSARSRLPAVSPAETGQGAESRAEPVVGVYFKQLRRQIRQTTPPDVSPRLLTGQAAPARFEVRENGLRFELSFTEGYSTGLFLDQRDNRRRLLTRHVAAAFPLLAREDGAGELLNCFAYTCAFSVCGAAGGMRTTSLDLSRKYLDWGRRNFALNGLDSAAHDFIYGDVFEWLQRLAKKGRRFQTVVLDPPTFSRSREHGDFRAESDYADLVSLALPLLASGGVLLASTNAARLLPERFVTQVRSAVTAAGRRVLLEHYVPQPPDFPVTREEPAHLKTLWMRIG